MNYRPGQSYYAAFTVTNPSTGAAADADSTPTALANRNGTDDGGFALTVTRLDTGRYKVAGTVPAGYVGGDVVSIFATAAVGGATGKGVIDSFMVDATVGPNSAVCSAASSATAFTLTFGSAVRAADLVGKQVFWGPGTANAVAEPTIATATVGGNAATLTVSYASTESGVTPGVGDAAIVG